MSTAFVYEIAAVHSAVQQMKPGDPQGIYAIPFYLVLGEPGAGRSTALRAMNLTWPTGDGTVRTGLPQQYCTYWMAQEAVFIEPQTQVVGPRRDAPALGMLCKELLAARPREALDGVLLVLSVAEFIDLDEGGVDRYAEALRKYLTEVSTALEADVPVYIVVSRYDVLWGFSYVFQWNKYRAREAPWVFVLPARYHAFSPGSRMFNQLRHDSARESETQWLQDSPRSPRSLVATWPSTSGRRTRWCTSAVKGLFCANPQWWQSIPALASRSQLVLKRNE